MRRPYVSVIPLVFGLLALGATASAAGSADECVSVMRNEQEGGLDFEVKNHCDRAVACTIRWTLACEDDHGKTTSTKEEAASFVVGKDDTKHQLGSAKSCKVNWRLDDIGWECGAAK